jgi:hypothetical protein
MADLGMIYIVHLWCMWMVLSGIKYLISEHKACCLGREIMGVCLFVSWLSFIHLSFISWVLRVRWAFDFEYLFVQENILEVHGSPLRGGPECSVQLNANNLDRLSVLGFINMLLVIWVQFMRWKNVSFCRLHMSNFISGCT